MQKLILASTSKYRQELLSRLNLPFVAQKPLFDEEAAKNPALSPQALAESLALGKAQSLAAPGQVVIGGDQLVAFEGKILGKAHTRERAIAQLQSLQGKTHELITAVCVIKDANQVIAFTDITRLTMRPLTLAQIERYIDLDQPLDCAGTYKIELHGISLFEKIESEDFTAIQGLPLLKLAQVLQTCGYTMP